MKLIFLGLVLLFASFSFAQDVSDIEDNSFLIEEAYNQEPGVVQHIGLFDHLGYKIDNTTYGEGGFAFTQEWPLLEQDIQFAYSVDLLRYETFSDDQITQFNAIGFSGGSLSFRYQLQSGVGTSPAIAPQIAFIFRDEFRGRESGYEVSLPVSFHLTKRLATHANAGFGIFPHRDEPQQTYLLGASAIFAAGRKLHLMLEAIAESERTELNGGSFTETTQIISPGFRYSIMLGNAQLVPGLGVPFHIEADRTNIGVLLYLSLEHNFIN